MGGTDDKGGIHTGDVHGSQVFIGDHNQVTMGPPALVSGKPAIDVEELKKTLIELNKSLDVLPEARRIDAQHASNKARLSLDDDQPKPQETVKQIQNIGEALRATGTAVKQGSQLATAVLKLAGIVGPLVVGGAKVVAAWFGIHLP